MSLTDHVDTSHWCPNCGCDREPNEDYTYFEGYYLEGQSGWTHVDNLSYGEGWSCDYCDTVYVDDDDQDTVHEGFVCEECGYLHEDWEDAAICCCNVCDTFDRDSGDGCDCHNIRFRFKTELFNKTGYRVLINDEDPEGSWGMMCAICHRKFGDESGAVEHTCGVNLWSGSPLRGKFMDWGWTYAMGSLDLVAAEFDANLDQPDEEEGEGPIIQQAYTNATHTGGVVLDEGPELMPPKKVVVEGCYICNETILCCIEHGTHKAEHRGCSEAHV